MFKVYIYIYAYIYIIYIYMLMLGFWHVQQLHEVCIYIYSIYVCRLTPQEFQVVH